VNGATGTSNVEGKVARVSDERMEPPGGAQHRWENREVEIGGST